MRQRFQVQRVSKPVRKAALKQPHSKRCRATPNASEYAKRLECGCFSAALGRAQIHPSWV